MNRLNEPFMLFFWFFLKAYEPFIKLTKNEVTISGPV
jgi:hypothetical protein